MANTLFNIPDFWRGRQFWPNLDFIVTIFIDPRHKRTFCIWLGVRYDKYKARTDGQKEILIERNKIPRQRKTKT